MEFYEIVKYDKRKFCEFYWDKIKRNQILIKTFIFKEETIPRELKIIVLIIYIDFVFISSALYFSTQKISELFYIEKNKNFFDYFQESINYIFSSVVSLTIFGYIVEFFFYDKKYIRYEMKKKRDDEKKLKLKIIQIIRKIKRRYITFLFISYILSMYSWYFISCFNNVYPNTKIYWMELSVNMIIILQLITIIFPFFESCLRFLAIKCNSEKIYKLSTYMTFN